MSTDQPIIQLKHVTKTYSTGSGGFTALTDINLDIYPGEFLGIVGKSGAGKTTFPQVGQSAEAADVVTRRIGC